MEGTRITHVDQNTNLIALITQTLADKNHPNPTAWEGYLDVNAWTADQKHQRFFINRAFRHIIALGRSVVDDRLSTEVRFNLIDDGEVKDWMRHFVGNVVPTLVKFNLPLQSK